MTLKLLLEPHRLAVCQLSNDVQGATLLSLLQSEWCCVLRTGNELSVVCFEHQAPLGAKIETGWRSLKLEGPFAFSMTGVLVSVLEPLAAANVGIFALSTFDTDCVLVKAEQLEQALVALRQAGHTVELP